MLGQSSKVGSHSRPTWPGNVDFILGLLLRLRSQVWSQDKTMLATNIDEAVYKLSKEIWVSR